MSGINDLSGDTYFASGDLNSSPSATFYLNTSAHTSGYDLAGIKTINGWEDHQTFSDQHYTVSYHVLGATSFTPLYTVNYTPFTATAQASMPKVHPSFRWRRRMGRRRWRITSMRFASPTD